jgi:transcription elongation GreA/GreB family factor
VARSVPRSLHRGLVRHAAALHADLSRRRRRADQRAERRAQAEIGGRLRDLQARHRLAWLVISHDLTMVHTLAHTAAVLMDGEVVE